MYDKVKLWIDRAIIGEQYANIANYLDNANTHINHQTGEIKTFGSLEGLKVSIFGGGLSVTGSLPKYLYGSNAYSLDRRTTAQAIEKISDALHLQVNEANVTGLEFGTNFLMKHQVSDYLAKLGSMPRLGRYHFDPQPCITKEQESSSLKYLFSMTSYKILKQKEPTTQMRGKEKTF